MWGVVAWVTASLPAVVLLPTPETFGVEPDEVVAISATVSRAILQATATPPLVGVAIDESCLADSPCVQGRLVDNGADAAVVINVIRSGQTLDVRERLYRRDGTLALEERRRSTMPLFEATPLSSGLVAALQAPHMSTATPGVTPVVTPIATPVSPPSPATAAATTNAPKTTTANASGGSLPVPGLATAAVGGACAVVGGVAFAVGAATVGSADSAGADKEFAYVYGWAGLATVLLGTTAAAVGVAMSVGALP